MMCERLTTPTSRKLPQLFSISSVGSFTSPSIWPVKEGWRRLGQRLNVSVQLRKDMNEDNILNIINLTSFLKTLVVGPVGVWIQELPLAEHVPSLVCFHIFGCSMPDNFLSNSSNSSSNASFHSVIKVTQRLSLHFLFIYIRGKHRVDLTLYHLIYLLLEKNISWKILWKLRFGPLLNLNTCTVCVFFRRSRACKGGWNKHWFIFWIRHWSFLYSTSKIVI